MKQYIERSELVERINKYVELTNPEEQEWVKDECIRQAHAMPSVNVGEWIRVDERLPHSQQMVIGYTPCDGYMFVGFYQKVDSPYWKSYWNVITAMRSTRKMTKKVTHWMPLPEPPVMKGGAE